MMVSAQAPSAEPSVAAASRALQASGAAWVLLGGFTAPEGDARDLSVLIEAGAQRAVDAALLDRGYLCVGARAAGRQRLYVAYDVEQDRWTRVRCVTGIAFGAAQELPADVVAALLARRELDGGVAALAPADAFWHALLRVLLDGELRRSDEKDRVHDWMASARDASPLAAFVDSLEAGAATRLIAAVESSDWASAEQIAQRLRARWRRLGGRRFSARRLGGLATRAVAAQPASRGLSLAILGPDGAGKTTLAEALVGGLPLPVRYVYLGMWQRKRWREHLRHIIGADLLVVIATLCFKTGLIAYHRRLGRVVVLDRFTYDADLPSSSAGWKARVSRRLVMSTCPDPDLIVLLDAPAEVMFARKGEHTLEKLEELRDGYLSLAQKYRQLTVVDATRPREEVRRQVTALLWARLRTTASAGRAAPPRSLA
ncbi:MAG: hypothetical protein M3304_00505 [Actinomycetota bacterium]|nr:hypothetical protein [Actinomycetota bacterium]